MNTRLDLPANRSREGRRIESHRNLHLNKRSCIVTNLIGIQRFTRESIVSRHGMVREMTKDTRIEGTSVILMQRSVKAQTGRRYFISFLFPLCFFGLFIHIFCLFGSLLNTYRGILFHVYTYLRLIGLVSIAALFL